MKRGEYVSAHVHFDILYLVVVKNSNMDHISILESKNSDVKWFDLDDCYNNKVVDSIKTVNKKIVKSQEKGA